MATFSLDQILTDEEIDKAIKIIQSGPDFLDQLIQVREQIIKPKIKKIDKILGQANDESFIALAVIAVLNKTMRPSVVLSEEELAKINVDFGNSTEN